VPDPVGERLERPALKQIGRVDHVPRRPELVGVAAKALGLALGVMKEHHLGHE
jgi:hypothetical protein